MDHSKPGPSPIQQWAKDEAQVPGSFIHEETRKNMGDALSSPPPHPNPPRKKADKERNWAFPVLILLNVITILAFLYLLYVLNGKEVVQQEPPVPREQHWSEVQRGALNYIRDWDREWERLAVQAIRDYYEKLVPGEQSPALCLKAGSEKTCYGTQEEVPLNIH